MNSRLTAIVASLVACLLVLLWYQSGTDESKPPAALIPVRIADSNTSPAGLLLQVALQQGHFEAEGLLPTIVGRDSYGGAHLNALLQGKLDVATASEVPIMRAGLSGKDIRVIATIGKGTGRHVSVVARKDRGIATLADLSGKRVGVSFGSNAEYYLDSLLTSRGLEASIVSKVHTKPGDIKKKLVAGDVDAIAAWFPGWKHAEEAIGDNAVTFNGDGIYTVFFNALVTPDFIGRRPEAINQLMRVFISAEKYADAHPQEVKALFAKFFRLNETTTEEVFNNYSLRTTLGQDLLVALESEAQWSIEKGLTKQKEMPNYLNFIHIESLDKVAPHAVSIIH